MAFPSPPSFESAVHPEQLLFLEFHAENRTLGDSENPNKMGGKDRWVDDRKEPAVEMKEDRLSDGLFWVCERADAGEIRAFFPFSAPTTAILLCLWSSWAGCALSFAVSDLLFPLLTLQIWVNTTDLLTCMTATPVLDDLCARLTSLWTWSADACHVGGCGLLALVAISFHCKLKFHFHCSWHSKKSFMMSYIYTYDIMKERERESYNCVL